MLTTLLDIASFDIFVGSKSVIGKTASHDATCMYMYLYFKV